MVSARLEGLSCIPQWCPVHRSRGAADNNRDKAKTRQWEGWEPSAKLTGGRDLTQPLGLAHEVPG